MRWASATINAGIAGIAAIALAALPNVAQAQNCTSRPDLCGLTVTSTIEQPDLAHAVDIVIVGDGYLDAYADGGAWQTEADNLIATFKGHTATGVYSSVAQIYNFHIVDVISATTDVTDTDTSDTALGMRSTGSSVITASGGAMNLAALNAPDVDVVIAVANTSGGRANANYNSQLTSGGRIRLSTNSSPVTHELGHAVFHLADEYLEASNCSQRNEAALIRERNVTAESTCFKWADVTGGCLEGARYCATGIFRSASSCLMRSSGNTATCPVCAKTISEMLLERRTGSDVADPWPVLSSPADGSSYAGNMTMSASLFDDWFAPLEIAFFIDGAYVATVSDVSTFGNTTVDTTAWANGTHTAYATVTDSAGHSSVSFTNSFDIINAGDPIVPIVEVQSPTDGATVSGSVWVSAAVTNGMADIINTIVYIDGVPVSASGSGSVWFSWDTSAVALGAHTISATALDLAQNLGVSTTVNVTVEAGTGGGFAGMWIGPPSVWESVGPAFVLSYNLMGVTAPTDLLLFVDNQLEATIPQVSLGPFGMTMGTLLVDASAWTLGVHVLDMVGDDGTQLILSNSIPVVRTVPVGPVALITYPGGMGGSSLSGIVNVEITGYDDVAVTSFDLSVDGTPIGSATTNPATIPWDTTSAADGCFTLSATAHDGDGNSGTSTPIFACTDNMPPTVSILWPGDGATVAPGLLVPLVDAVDLGGFIAAARLFVDAVEVSASNNATRLVADLALGSRTLVVEVTDGAGFVASSAAITVTVASCASAADCNDGDACTTDSCAATGACLNDRITGCCAIDGDCDDGDPCTTDACPAATCTNTAIAGCCTHGYQCSDGDSCTQDLCSSVGGTCSNPANNCCSVAADCDDANSCTVDDCIGGPAGICVNAWTADCCFVNEDCDDGDPCTDGTCTAGVCGYALIAGCCVLSSECDDGDPCTDDWCSSNVCTANTSASCCFNDGDCAPADPCATGSCDIPTNRCSWGRAAGCCTFGFDCNDWNPCTEDLCMASVCSTGPADLCLDSDADGIADGEDNCPADSNPGQLDGDIDLVGDVCDNCPVDNNRLQVDADSDGTGDLCDGCPADGGKVTPGVCGCGVADADTDSDGTPDCNDACPTDPGKIAAGVCGCGVTDADTDSDGTLDCNDGCPTDPGKTTVGVCGCGVADTDTDSDGTLDCNDGCPTDATKVAAGVCGCGVADTDGDSDGTPDCNDACPTDPAKIVAGACGCGVAETDGDGDGTPDCIDGCPADPALIVAGACGCGVPETDSDGDGTPDCIDGCPADPGKSAPGACGCGTADTDTDSDGTPDCVDGCPGDAGKTTAGVCGCGVPDSDSDSDGTLDCNDGCPADPSKTAPGVCGCGVADTDGDSDGTLDCNDGCPADAAKTAPMVCGCGVADTDTDSDGTLDCNDGCPTDAAKTAPAVCGCGVVENATDTDGDGSPDCADGCIDDAAKTAAGVCGCGVVEDATDTDGDGIPDCADECVDDGAKVAADTCGCGSPETDTDNDATPDCIDACPNDASSIAAPCSDESAAGANSQLVSGCNCSANAAPAAPLWLLLLLVVGWRARRNRHY